MRTPKKSEDIKSEGSPLRTPFHERAIEEQRLKEELLLTSTPGLKKKPAYFNETKIITNDPADVRSYFRDLSSVLVSQNKKDLTSRLAEEGGLSYFDEKTEIPSSVDKEENLSMLGQASSLMERVFENLQPTEFRSKSRKVIRPVVIKDVELLPYKAVSEEPSFDIIDTDTPVIESKLEDDARKPITEEGMLSDYEESISMDTDPEEIDPLPMTKLKKSMHLFMAQNNIVFDKKSWPFLQKASELLIEKISEELMDDEKRLVPDRQNILEVFEGYEILPEHATNEELFELCCKYLPLEDLNILEMSLFL